MFVSGNYALNETDDSLLIPESPTPSSDIGGEGTWHGNIQYIFNISSIGEFCCLRLFLFVKLCSDYKV